MLILRIFSTNT